MLEAREIRGTKEELTALIQKFLKAGYVCDNEFFGSDPFNAVKNGGRLLVCDGDEIKEKGFIALSF